VALLRKDKKINELQQRAKQGNDSNGGQVEASREQAATSIGNRDLFQV
jgi:hypothetical protein